MINYFKSCCLMAVTIVTIVAVIPEFSCNAAQTVYTKNADFPIVRLRYSDLEDILAKASRLATEANRQVLMSSNFLDRLATNYGQEFVEGQAQRFAEQQRQRILAEFPREEIMLSATGEELSLPGHLITKATRIPDEASSIIYSYDFYYEPMPITKISLQFNDSFRRIEVRGISAEHVDAVMNTLHADFLRFSTSVGGSRFRM